jgi:hypothetical protein
MKKGIEVVGVLSGLLLLAHSGLAHATEKESGGKISVLGASQLSMEAIYDVLSDAGLLDVELTVMEKLPIPIQGDSQVFLVRFQRGSECKIQKFHVSVACYEDDDKPEKGIYKHAVPVGQPLNCS